MIMVLREIEPVSAGFNYTALKNDLQANEYGLTSRVILSFNAVIIVHHKTSVVKMILPFLTFKGG